MNKKIHNIGWSLCIISLLAGCTAKVENKDIEKIIVSDTAADALLMDVEGLDNLDDIDALIEELSIIEALEEPGETVDATEPPVTETTTEPSVIVAEPTPVVVEPVETPTQTTDVEPAETVGEEPPREEKDQSSNFFGQIKRVNGKKLVIQIVRVEKIDRSVLESMTVEERRKTLQESVTYTEYYRTIFYDDGTNIVSNGASVGSDQLVVDRFVQVAIAKNGTVKTIRMANLRFK